MKRDTEMKDITLLAVLRRIKRKADIMVLDAPRNSAVEQNIKELQLLTDIALRSVEGKEDEKK
jgi:hypothetical protein